MDEQMSEESRGYVKVKKIQRWRHTAVIGAKCMVWVFLDLPFISGSAALQAEMIIHDLKVLIFPHG